MPLAAAKLSFTPACSTASLQRTPVGVERDRLVLGALQKQDGDAPRRIGRQALVAETVAARALHAAARAGGEAVVAMTRFARSEDVDLLDALGLDAEIRQQRRQQRAQLRLVARADRFERGDDRRRLRQADDAGRIGDLVAFAGQRAISLGPSAQPPKMLRTA